MSEFRQSGDSPRLAAFDGLRGIAALAVMAFHCELWLGRQIDHGYLAVDAFFLLSGVVIDRAYGARLRAGWPVRAFMRTRIARLYPAYLASLAFGFGTLTLAGWLGRPIVPTEIGERIAAASLALLLLPYPFVGGGYDLAWPINPPAWSLWFELVANLAFALIVRRLSDSRLALLTACGALFLTACVCLFRNMEQGWNLMTLPGGVGRVWFGFFAGVVLSRLHASGRFDRLPRLGLAPLAAILCAILIFPRGIPCEHLVALGVVLVVMPIMVSLALVSDCGPRTAALSARLGSLSYPIYVIHFPMICLADLLVPSARAEPVAAWVAAGLAVALTLAWAALSLRWGPAIVHRLRAVPRRAETPEIVGRLIPQEYALDASGRGPSLSSG